MFMTLIKNAEYPFLWSIETIISNKHFSKRGTFFACIVKRMPSRYLKKIAINFGRTTLVQANKKIRHTLPTEDS